MQCTNVHSKKTMEHSDIGLFKEGVDIFYE
jgi:hypothetical protein